VKNVSELVRHVFIQFSEPVVRTRFDAGLRAMWRDNALVTDVVQPHFRIEICRIYGPVFEKKKNSRHYRGSHTAAIISVSRSLYMVSNQMSAGHRLSNYSLFHGDLTRSSCNTGDTKSFEIDRCRRMTRIDCANFCDVNNARLVEIGPIIMNLRAFCK